MGDIVNEHTSEESNEDEPDPVNTTHTEEPKPEAQQSEDTPSATEQESPSSEEATAEQPHEQKEQYTQEEEPIFVGEVDVTTAQGIKQKETYLSLTPEQLDSLVNHLDGTSYLNSVENHFDESTQRHIYRFTSDSKTYTAQLKQLLISVFGKTGYPIVDFSRWVIFGFYEGISGLEVQESYIGKSNAQERGRKIGRYVGAALGISKFIHQAFLFYC